MSLESGFKTEEIQKKSEVIKPEILPPQPGEDVSSSPRLNGSWPRGEYERIFNGLIEKRKQELKMENFDSSLYEDMLDRCGTKGQGGYTRGVFDVQFLDDAEKLFGRELNPNEINELYDGLEEDVDTLVVGKVAKKEFVQTTPVSSPEDTERKWMEETNKEDKITINKITEGGFEIPGIHHHILEAEFFSLMMGKSEVEIRNYLAQTEENLTNSGEMQKASSLADRFIKGCNPIIAELEAQVKNSAGSVEIVGDVLVKRYQKTLEELKRQVNTVKEYSKEKEIDKIKGKLLRGFDLTEGVVTQAPESIFVMEPLPEENQQEYIARFFKSITDRHIDKSTHLGRENYKNYAGIKAQQEFTGDEKAREKFLATLKQLTTREDARQTPEKDKKTLQTIELNLFRSNNSLATGEEDQKIRHFANTNQTRSFFKEGKKPDDLSYSAMMFGIPSDILKTIEGKEYMHSQIDGKNIFLFGGGDSIKDLLISEEYHPDSVVNFDPYIKSEIIEKNKNGIYSSEMISATSPEIQKKVASGELPKADEVWATYSVPFYLDSPQDITNLINNMTSILAEGGNARISPIMIQGQETEAGSFETRKVALMEAIKATMNKGDFNVTVFNNTIQIHKIKVTKQSTAIS